MNEIRVIVSGMFSGESREDIAFAMRAAAWDVQNGDHPVISQCGKVDFALLVVEKADAGDGGDVAAKSKEAVAV